MFFEQRREIAERCPAIVEKPRMAGMRRPPMGILAVARPWRWQALEGIEQPEPLVALQQLIGDEGG